MTHQRRGRRRFTDETFLRAWRSCESVVQTARRLGCDVPMVMKYAERLREQGVELPKQEVSQ